MYLHTYYVHISYIHTLLYRKYVNGIIILMSVAVLFVDYKLLLLSI